MTYPKEMTAGVVVRHGEVELRKLPVPQPGPFDALVRIEVCGLCGTTDREIVAGTQAHHPADCYPAVLGHEAVGTVIAIGENVRCFKVGDRVTHAAAIWPGESRDGYYSGWGEFAEYGLVRDGRALAEATDDPSPQDGITSQQSVVPPDMDPVAATLAIGLSEVASWWWKLGPVGGRPFAIGGAGFVGYVMCVLAKLAGAGPVILVGRRNERLDHGRRCGADVTVNSKDADAAEAVREAAGGMGVDCFAEASGADEMFNLGLGTLCQGGTLAIYGAPQGYRYTLQMKRARGEFDVRLMHPAENTALDWVCRIIRQKRIDTQLLHSHVWEGLDCLPEAIQAQENGEVIKGLVRISG